MMGRKRPADSILFVESVEMKAFALRVYTKILVSSHLPFICYFKMQDSTGLIIEHVIVAYLFTCSVPVSVLKSTLRNTES